MELLPLWIALAAINGLLLRAIRNTQVGVSMPPHTSGPRTHQLAAGRGLCPACAGTPPPPAD